jgi:hypothetical protein
MLRLSRYASALAVLSVVIFGGSRTHARTLSCGCEYYTYDSGYYYFFCADDPTCDENKIPCGTDVCGADSIGDTSCGSGGGENLLQIECISR